MFIRRTIALRPGLLAARPLTGAEARVP